MSAAKGYYETPNEHGVFGIIRNMLRLTSRNKFVKRLLLPKIDKIVMRL